MAPEPVRTEELSDALTLLLRRGDAADRAGRVAAAMDLMRRGELDPGGLFVLRRRGGLAGAVLALALPGACGLIWPPQCAPDDPAAEDALLARASAWLRGRGVRVAQALLSSEEAGRARALPRGGYTHITRLWFLRHDLSFPTHLLGAAVRLDCRPYDPADPAAFHRALQETYQDTLDCPELNGARSVDEVVAGHRGAGRFDPARWLLARAGGEPAGVLLLAEAPDAADWEVSYVGVVPALRRRGFGRELMLRALAEARAGGAAALTLSVDARNGPARDLYRALGFEPYDAREVFLAVWK